MQLPDFESCIRTVEFGENGFIPGENAVSFDSDPLPQLYKGFIFGIRYYFEKMGFEKAIIGASGGVDSALVQILAVHALGA